MFIHPGSQISDTGSRIQDPTTATKEERRKTLVSLLPTFNRSHKLHKIVKYFIFEQVQRNL
jgi:hypothetical protein